MRKVKFKACDWSKESFDWLNLELIFFRLPKLKYVGVLSEWGGLDRAGIIAIKAYVLGNNLNIDIESMQDRVATKILRRLYAHL